MQRSRRAFVWMHALLPLAVPLFFLYRAVTERLPAGMTGCVLHDYLFLYCPLCGGTRAVESLLHLDFEGALEKNAFVLLLLCVFLLLDVLAWRRFFQGKSPWSVAPAWVWVSLTAALILFGVLRNYLMIAHGIDPTGDLGRVWEALLN